ncbi:Uncharacterized protein TPAR_04381, partial [Tolypocladium paradoxum]
MTAQWRRGALTILEFIDALSAEGPAGANAINNLYRCLLAAGGVSVIQPLISAVKIMNAFLIVAGVVCLFSPVWVQWTGCEKWNWRKRERAGKSTRKGSSAFSPSRFTRILYDYIDMTLRSMNDNLGFVTCKRYIGWNCKELRSGDL